MAPLQRRKLTTVAFSIGASSMCGGEKQKQNQKKKEGCVNAEVSLIYSLGSLHQTLEVTGGRRECGVARTPTASLLPGLRPRSAAFWKSSSSGDIWCPCCPLCSCLALPGQNEIGGEGGRWLQRGVHTQGRIRVREVRPGAAAV